MTGRELAERRQKLALSQEDVAQLAGLIGRHRRMTVSKWETGTKPLTRMVSHLLDIELGRLEALDSINLEAERREMAHLIGKRERRVAFK